MPHATVPSPGLQALILCGPGSSLSTFTSNPKDFPKAIIPIANRPMVWYPLDWCYRMGISDITLITPPESEAALESALATNPALTSLPNPKPEILAPEGLTQTTGTGELLRLEEVQKTIVGDFVVLPCDLISEMDGTRVLQQWMTLNPLTTANSTATSTGQRTSSNSKKLKGGMAVFYPTYGHETISTKKDETDFLGTIPLTPNFIVPPPNGSLRSTIEQVVLSMPTDTLRDNVEADKGFFRLRQSLLSKHSRVKMRTKHRDAHVYVFPHWVKEWIAGSAAEDFESVSEDVLGWWAKASWQGERLVEKVGLSEVLDPGSRARDEGGNAGDVVDEVEDEVDLTSLSSTKVTPVPAMQEEPQRTFATRVGAHIPSIPARKPITIPPLLAYIQPPPLSTSTQPLIRRTDTSAQLLSISLYLAKQPLEHSLAHEHKIHPTAKLEQQARVSNEDSLIGENVKLGFRSNVKECVVGANCEVGKNARLTRCLLMEGVVVGDGVQLVGCIVGRRARIEGSKAADSGGGDAGGGNEAASGKGKKGKERAADGDDDERTRLTECEVAPGFVVEAGTEAKGEKFMGFDTGEMDGFDDEDEEGDVAGGGDGEEE